MTKTLYNCTITTIKAKSNRFYIEFRDEGDEDGNWIGFYEMFTSSANTSLNNSLRNLYLRKHLYMAEPMAIEYHRGRKHFIIDDIRYVPA